MRGGGGGQGLEPEVEGAAELLVLDGAELAGGAGELGRGLELAGGGEEEGAAGVGEAECGGGAGLAHVLDMLEILAVGGRALGLVGELRGEIGDLRPGVADGGGEVGGGARVLGAALGARMARSASGRAVRRPGVELLAEAVEAAGGGGALGGSWASVASISRRRRPASGMRPLPPARRMARRAVRPGAKGKAPGDADLAADVDRAIARQAERDGGGPDPRRQASRPAHGWQRRRRRGARGPRRPPRRGCGPRRGGRRRRGA